MELGTRLTTGVGCTIGGAAGNKSGLLVKSSNVNPVTEALNSGFFTTFPDDESGGATANEDDVSPFDRSDMFVRIVYRFNKLFVG